MREPRLDAIARLLATGGSRRNVLLAALGTIAAGAGKTAGPAHAEEPPRPTKCRPDVSVFPGRPQLDLPFRAVRKGEAAPCPGSPVAPGVTPKVTGGYAGDAFTHVDSFFNEYYAVDWGTGGYSFPVLAAADGILMRQDERGSNGEPANTLFIKHSDYWQTKYTHLSGCGLIDNIADGAQLSRPVKQGEQIAWSGDTGADAIHLHFELRGGRVNYSTSFASPKCCGFSNCNWSYPVGELGVPAPPAITGEDCVQPKRCPVKSGSAPDQAITCCQPPQPEVVPGGMWISPAENTTISGQRLRLEAQAYPAAGAPAIDYVNFTLWWPGHGPRNAPWYLACSVHDHEGDIYRCDVDLAQAGVDEGAMTVSFDVYDVAGNHNLAPHGTRAVTWRLDTGCPAGQVPCNQRCVNLRTSVSHCGRCNNQCGIFQICCAGECGCDGSVIVPGYCMGARVIC